MQSSITTVTRCVAFAALVFVSSGCQTVSAFEYIAYAARSSQTSVRLENVDDFVRRAESLGIDTLFVNLSDLETSNEFLYYTDGVLFVVEGNGYNSVESYREGTRAGFENGVIFRDALANGFRTFEEYNSYRQTWFLNGDDYRQSASQAGPLENDASRGIPFPRLMTAELFETVYAPLMAFDMCWSIEPKHQMSSNAWDDVFKEFGIPRPDSNRRNRGELPWDDFAQTVPYHLVPAFLDAVAECVISDPSIVRYNKQESDGRVEYVRNAEWSGWVAGWDEHLAELTYYSASLNGYSTLQQFRDDQGDLVQSIRQGYLSIHDMEVAHAGGFESNRDFYDARDVGINTYDEFRMYERIRVGIDEYNTRYLPLIQRMEELKDIQRRSDWLDAFVLVTFDNVPAGRAVSLDTVYDSFVGLRESFPQVTNLEPGIRTLRRDGFDSIVQRNIEALSRIGQLRLSDDVFVGR